MKKLIIVAGLFVVLVFLFALVIVQVNRQNAGITAAAIKELGSEYSYTKAICNATNFCQDYEITCYNGKLFNAKPLKSAQLSNNFKTEKVELNDNLCK